MGGGSLFAAEELLKYPTIVSIDIVDFDINVIEATLIAYPERQYIINNSRINILEDMAEGLFIQYK